ncbi:MAG: hypothetical protein MUP71_11100 [Candidatus Aminicenantes bacterium]|nr:hypothetical protein [Candidatus Aminicenantes bacterium]
MFHKTLLFLMLLLTAFFCFTQQDAIYFAAGTEGLDPFIAIFKNGRFVPIVVDTLNSQSKYKIFEKQLAEALRKFPVKKSVTSLGESGRLHELVVLEYNPKADVYTPILKLQNPPNELTLATNTPVKLIFLPSKEETLSLKELNMLKEKAQEIWRKERIQLEKWERPKAQLTLLNPKIFGIEELPDIVTVVFPVLFSRYESVDDRGSFFFLFDRKTDKILRAHFGHPEWSAASPDSVINIEPHMFFRIADFATPYLLADFEWGWESNGLAIINMTTGDIEALTTY